MVTKNPNDNTESIGMPSNKMELYDHTDSIGRSKSQRSYAYMHYSYEVVANMNSDNQ